MKNPAFKICEVTSCCSTEAYEKLEVVFCGVSRRDWTKKSSSSWTRAQHKHRMDAGDQSGPVICTLCAKFPVECLSLRPFLRGSPAWAKADWEPYSVYLCSSLMAVQSMSLPPFTPTKINLQPWSFLRLDKPSTI